MQCNINKQTRNEQSTIAQYSTVQYFVEVEQHLQREERVVLQECRMQNGVRDARVAVDTRLQQQLRADQTHLLCCTIDRIAHE